MKRIDSKRIKYFKQTYRGGTGEMYLVILDDDSRYLFKPSFQKGTSKLESFRAYAQKAAHDLQKKLLPDRTVPLEIVEIAGMFGTLQEEVDIVPENFKKRQLDAGSFSKNETNQILEEAICDYLLFNYDAHGGNFIRGWDGKIYGIDKEQTLKYVLNPKVKDFDLNFNPNKSYGEAETIYNYLFKKYLDGEIDLDFTSVFDVYHRAKALTTEEYLDIFYDYFVALKKQFPRADIEAIKEVMVDRKENLNDFLNFLIDLKKKRDKIKHNDLVNNMLEEHHLNEEIESFNTYYNELLPKIEALIKDEKQEKILNDFLNDLRRIQKEGYRVAYDLLFKTNFYKVIYNLDAYKKLEVPYKKTLDDLIMLHLDDLYDNEMVDLAFRSNMKFIQFFEDAPDWARDAMFQRELLEVISEREYINLVSFLSSDGRKSIYNSPICQLFLNDQKTVEVVKVFKDELDKYSKHSPFIMEKLTLILKDQEFLFDDIYKKRNKLTQEDKLILLEFFFENGSQDFLYAPSDIDSVRSAYFYHLNQYREELQNYKEGFITNDYLINEALLKLSYGLSFEDALYMTKKYRSILNDDFKDYESKDLQLLESIVNIVDKKYSKEELNEMIEVLLDENYRPKIFTTFIIDSIFKRMYTKDYAKNITQIKNDSAYYNYSNMKDLSVIENGDVLVLDAGVNFNFIVHAWRRPIDDNRNNKVIWNPSHRSASFGICGSLITNEGTGAIDFTSPFLGFQEFNNEAFLEMGPCDIWSITGDFDILNSQVDDHSKFLTLKQLPDQTRYGYNEIVFSRIKDGVSREPDYALFFRLQEDYQDTDLYKESFRIAKEFNIPLVIIDYKKVKAHEKRAIDSLEEKLFNKDNTNPALIQKIVARYVNNYLGNIAQMHANYPNEQRDDFSINGLKEFVRKLYHHIINIEDEVTKEKWFETVQDAYHEEKNKYEEIKGVGKEINSVDGFVLNRHSIMFQEAIFLIGKNIKDGIKYSFPEPTTYKDPFTKIDPLSDKRENVVAVDLENLQKTGHGFIYETVDLNYEHKNINLSKLDDENIYKTLFLAFMTLDQNPEVVLVDGRLYYLCKRLDNKFLYQPDSFQRDFSENYYYIWENFGGSIKKLIYELEYKKKVFDEATFDRVYEMFKNLNKEELEKSSKYKLLSGEFINDGINKNDELNELNQGLIYEEEAFGELSLFAESLKEKWGSKMFLNYIYLNDNYDLVVLQEDDEKIEDAYEIDSEFLILKALFNSGPLVKLNGKTAISCNGEINLLTHDEEFNFDSLNVDRKELKTKLQRLINITPGELKYLKERLVLDDLSYENLKKNLENLILNLSKVLTREEGLLDEESQIVYNIQSLGDLNTSLKKGRKR